MEIRELCRLNVKDLKASYTTTFGNKQLPSYKGFSLFFNEDRSGNQWPIGIKSKYGDIVSVESFISVQSEIQQQSSLPTFKDVVQKLIDSFEDKAEMIVVTPTFVWGFTNINGKPNVLKKPIGSFTPVTFEGVWNYTEGTKSADILRKMLIICAFSDITLFRSFIDSYFDIKVFALPKSQKDYTFKANVPIVCQVPRFSRKELNPAMKQFCGLISLNDLNKNLAFNFETELKLENLLLTHNIFVVNEASVKVLYDSFFKEPAGSKKDEKSEGAASIPEQYKENVELALGMVCHKLSSIYASLKEFRGTAVIGKSAIYHGISFDNGVSYLGLDTPNKDFVVTPEMKRMLGYLQSGYVEKVFSKGDSFISEILPSSLEVGVKHSDFPIFHLLLLNASLVIEENSDGNASQFNFKVGTARNRKRSANMPTYSFNWFKDLLSPYYTKLVSNYINKNKDISKDALYDVLYAFGVRLSSALFYTSNPYIKGNEENSCFHYSPYLTFAGFDGFGVNNPSNKNLVDVLNAMVSEIRKDNKLSEVTQAILCSDEVVYSSKGMLPSTSDRSYVSVMLCVDEKVAVSETLFAYKAYDDLFEAKGKAAFSESILIGRNVDTMRPVHWALNNQANVANLVIAGSGSGKGVLTLTALMNMEINENLVIYADAKPDMAVTLWDMCGDTPSFIVDGMGGLNRVNANLSPIGYNAIDVWGKALNIDVKALDELEKVRGVEVLTICNQIPVLKAMTLFCAMAQLRSQGNAKINSLTDPTKKIFIIMDELEVFNNKYLELKKGLQTAISSLRNSGGFTSAIQNIEKYLDVYYSSLQSSIKALLFTHGRKGNASIVALGQNADPNKWVVDGSGNWSVSTFGQIVGSASTKLIGKGGGSATVKYGIPQKFKDRPLVNEMGYWSLCNQAASGEDESAKFIKSYLFLNRNDYKVGATAENGFDGAGEFTAKMLRSANDVYKQQEYIQDFVNLDGTIRAQVGFDGGLQYYSGQDASTILSRSYNVFETMLQEAGIFAKCGVSSLTEYLYSVDPVTFLTVGEIVSAVKGEVKQLDGIPTTKYGLFLDLSESEVMCHDRLNEPAVLKDVSRYMSEDFLKGFVGEDLVLEVREYLNAIQSYMLKEGLDVVPTVIPFEALPKSTVTVIENSLFDIVDDILSRDRFMLESKADSLCGRAIKSIKSSEKEGNAEAISIIKKNTLIDFSNIYQGVIKKSKMNLPNAFKDAKVSTEQIEEAEKYYLDNAKAIVEDIIAKMNNAMDSGLPFSKSGSPELSSEAYEPGDSISDVDESENASEVNSAPSDGYLGEDNFSSEPDSFSKGSKVDTSKVLNSEVDSRDLYFNLDKPDAIGNVKVIRDLTDRVIEDIIKKFGSKNHIESIEVDDSFRLFINNYRYNLSLDDSFKNSLPEVAKDELRDGSLKSVVSVGAVIRTFLPSLVVLKLSAAAAGNSILKSELGIRKYCFERLFKVAPNLEKIILPDKVLTDGESEKNFEKAEAERLSYFNLANSPIGALWERAYQTRPVRVLTSALGWTMGIKVVALAASVFGPWGMLFGVLAGASAYNNLRGNNYRDKNSSKKGD